MKIGVKIIIFAFILSLSVMSGNEVLASNLVILTWPQFGYDPQSSGQSPFKGPQTNKLKWVYKIGTTSCGYQTHATTPVLDKDGNLYFGTSEGSFISLDPQMKKRWEFKLPDAYPRNICKDGYEPAMMFDENITSTPVISNGRVIFGTSGLKNAKKIYALDLNGNQVWSYPIDNTLESHIKLGSNGRIYFNTATTLYSLADTGQDVKTYPVTTRWNTPAIGKDGTVYVCSAEGLLALTPDLKLKWVFSQTKNLKTCSPAVDPKSGVVYFPYKNQANSEYKLYALNSDGSLKWKTDVYWMESSPTVATDGTIYLSTTDLSVDTKNHSYQTRGSGELIALNPDGSKKWSYNVAPSVCKMGSDKDCLTADRYYSTTAIDLASTVGADGTIYFGSDGSRYYALNPNGTVKWVFNGGDEWDRRVVIAPDGTLYAAPGGNINGGLYAFSDGTNTTPYQTPTPPSASYSDGTLINDHGTIYIMEYGQKRGIVSMEVFNGLGFKLQNVISADISSIPTGQPLGSSSQRHPRGTFILSQGTVYFLGANLRYPFPSAEVFYSWGNDFKDVVNANSYDISVPVGPIVQMK